MSDDRGEGERIQDGAGAVILCKSVAVQVAAAKVMAAQSAAEKARKRIAEAVKGFVAARADLNAYLAGQEVTEILSEFDSLGEQYGSSAGSRPKDAAVALMTGRTPSAPESPPWHGLPVDDRQFALHGRVRNALQKAGYATMGDVVRSGTEWFKVVGEDGKKRILDIVQHGGHPAQVTMSAENPRSGEGFEVGGVPVRSANGKAGDFMWPKGRDPDCEDEYPLWEKHPENPNIIRVVHCNREYFDDLIGEAGPAFGEVERDAEGFWMADFHGRARDLILSHASE